MDDHIQEIVFDSSNNGKYFKGHSFPTPLKGTALAFISQPRVPPPGQQPVIIRGYYQHSDLRIMEIVWDGEWHAGKPLLFMSVITKLTFYQGLLSMATV